jgi:hypothetical protein
MDNLNMTGRMFLWVLWFPPPMELYMLAIYVPGDIKYIFTKCYRHISTNIEANRKFVILISNFSTRLWRFKLKMHCGIEI